MRMNPTVHRSRSISSGNYCCSSIRMASVDENKNSPRKITMTHTQATCLNLIALSAGEKGACPAEVGDLGTVFEKSSLELKQKLLKCKQTIQIATVNVRTLNKIRQLPELTASAIDHDMHSRTQVHSADIRYHDSGNGWTLATASAWKNSINATIGGVGMLIGPRALKSRNSRENTTYDNDSYF